MNDKIFLLSTAEADELPLKILRCGQWWWLRSRGYCREINAAYVSSDGALDDSGLIVSSYYGGVRPALLLDGTEDIQSWKGNIVNYLNIAWLDISEYLGEPVLLAKDIIFTSRFDSKSNDYEKSEIRQKLFEWLLARTKKQ